MDGRAGALGLRYRRATNADADAVKAIVFGVLREYGLEPEPEGIDSDLENIADNYLASGGEFEVIVDSDDRVLGTCGLYPLDETTVELRKMYFLPQIRGRGLGKELLGRALDTARELGFRTVELETANVLKEAIGLYRSFGFEDSEGGHANRCDRSFFLEL